VAVLGDLYRRSLTLLTDLYQLSMAYGYWRSGVCDLDAAVIRGSGPRGVRREAACS